MPNFRDYIQPDVTLSDSYTEILATQHGMVAVLRQLPSDSTQKILLIRHRSASDSDTEEIPIGGTLVKRGYRASTGSAMGIRIGDTLGFVATITGAAELQIKIFEE